MKHYKKYFYYTLFLGSGLYGNIPIKAPRPQEPAGISIYPFDPATGSNIHGEVERDEHVPRDLFVGRNLTVAGSIIGPVFVTPPLILKPFVGNQACIIFQQADGFEKARICSTDILNDKGVFISVDGGATENFRITNDGDTSLANNLLLLDSTSTVGNVYKNGTLFLHNFGVNNTFLGDNAGNLTLTGSNNVGIGLNAGSALTTGSNNIYVGAGQSGVATENFTTRIGAGGTTTSCFIEGIDGVSIGASADLVGINSSDQLGTTATDFTLTGNLDVTGTITGVISVIPPLTLQPLVGNQACIIFEQSDGFEKARICSTTVLNDKGVFISVDGGVTENFRVTNDGDTSLANNFLLLDSTTTVGNVYKAGTLFLHNFGGGNTFLGQNAGNLTLSGTGNTAMGNGASFALTTGDNNTAVGIQSLGGNTTGSGNVAVGRQALVVATTGSNNTALGSNAMSAGIVTGSNNSALGSSALASCTSGANNTALGNGSLGNLLTGTDNVMIGYLAGTSLTGAESNNIFIGVSQIGNGGDSNTIRIGGGGASTRCFIEGINGVNVGASANLVGVLAGTNQLGTTATVFTLTGSESITANLLLGDSSSTTGNILKGGIVFMNNFGPTSTFLGGLAGGNFANTGGNNTGIGYQALTQVTTGTNNVGVGNNALTATQSGSDNVAVGVLALQANTSGTANIGIGKGALQSSTIASQNIAIGELALNALTTGGSQNVAIGIGAGRLMTGGGNNNVLIGTDAGSSLNGLFAENNNIYIGAGQLGVSGEIDTTRIGCPGLTSRCFIDGIVLAVVPLAVPVVIGPTGQLGTIVSSRRYKENIANIEDSSDRFMKLNPVSFTYQKDQNKTLQYGFIAEEVEELYPELVVRNEDGEPETVAYHLFYALLVKMIQENRKLTEELRITTEKNSSLLNELVSLYAVTQQIR